MVFAIIFLIFLMFIVIWVASQDYEESNSLSLIFDGLFLGWITGVLVILICSKIDSVVHPEGLVHPIDVYRGNTELKINGHIQDSVFVPDDSTVVFNEKYLLKHLK